MAEVMSLQQLEDKVLVTLDILEYYDQRIKNYIKNKIAESGGSVSSSNIKFYDSVGQFPTIGQEEILYITRDSIYQWNNSTQKYEQIISTLAEGETTLQWGKIQ